jgi:urease accessory protein
MTMDTNTAIDWLPSLLQVSDPLFPTGAYAHSSALEEVVRMGLVSTESSLSDFLLQHIIPLLQNLELPYVRYAYAAAEKEDLETLVKLNLEISASKICREAREASIQLGSRRMLILRKIVADRRLEDFTKQVATPHHVVVYGLQMASIHVPLSAALTAYHYQALAGICSAALKLIRIGQEGIQRVLRTVLDERPGVIQSSMKIEREEAGWFNPLLEIASMRHEHAGERLFIS